MATDPKPQKSLKRSYYSASRWHSGDVMVGNITFLTKQSIQWLTMEWLTQDHTSALCYWFIHSLNTHAFCAFTPLNYCFCVTGILFWYCLFNSGHTVWCTLPWKTAGGSRKNDVQQVDLMFRVHFSASTPLVGCFNVATGVAWSLLNICSN